MATSSDSAIALISQEGMSISGKKTWASERDWVRHRTQITHLYQAKSLGKVMGIMESQYGFKATPTMYKNRIRHWGLDKNSKEPEMRAMVRKHDRRQRQGKASVFRVRGKPVEFGDIIRYWERKGMSIEDVVAQRAMSATPEAVVECSTPVPSPPSTPEGFAIPENVIRSVRDYYHGSFELGTWYSTDPQYPCRSAKARGAEDTIQRLLAQCQLACRLFTLCKFEEAGRTLIYAFASIEHILQEQSPITLCNLFSLTRYIAQLNRLEIAIALLRQISNMGELILGGCHPLSRVCRWLASLESSHFQDVLTVCHQSACDQFEYFLGPMHWSTLISRLDYIQWAQDVGQEGAAIQKQLASCIRSLGRSDVRTLQSYRALAYQNLKKRDYIAAQRLAREIIHHTQGSEPRNHLTWVHCEGLWVIAQSQYEVGETASAEANLRRAIELRMWEQGTNDSQARYWLVKLEEWVRVQGNFASALQLENWRNQILDSMEANDY